MIPELLPTALAFYRAPGQYSQLRDARLPLPAGVSELLGAHAHALSAEQIDDTAARLNCSPEECRAAVTFFIKQALLEARGDHYRTLGVSRDADSALIRQHYHYLIRLFHPDRDLNREGWETLYAPVINEAWNQLRTPAKRREYDASLPPPDAFDAVLAQGRDPRGPVGVAASPWKAEPLPAKARALALMAMLATLPPRVILGMVFGLPLLLVLLWLLAQPAPQSLRVAGQESGAAVAEPPAGTPVSTSQEADPAPMAAPARVAPHRASPEELERQVRERLASATRAVLGPGAAAGARRQSAPTPAPEPSPEPQVAAAPADEPLPAYQDAAAVVPEPVAEITQTPQPAAIAQAPEPQQDAVSAPEPLAVQVAAAPAERAPAPDVLLPLDQAQLAAVMEAFAENYEAGDAQRFSALFTADADTPDGSGRELVRRVYRDFFARPESREIRFGRMRWEFESPLRSRGIGPVRVTTVPFDGGQVASGELTITLGVEQTVTGPMIVSIHYQ
jgi:hypothetical protein